jgi:hypothetical protein
MKNILGMKPIHAQRPQDKGAIYAGTYAYEGEYLDTYIFIREGKKRPIYFYRYDDDPQHYATTTPEDFHKILSSTKIFSK